VRILLADDHEMMRDGLRAVLAREADLQVVAEAGDGRAAVALAGTVHPDVVVMDISMRGLNGIEATRQLHARHPRLKVVALSTNCDSRYVEGMFEAGASAYVVKSAAAEELVRALRAVARGERYLSPEAARVVIDSSFLGERSPLAQGVELTPREREVLQLLAEGLASKEIADRLEVAVSTIESHRKQIMARLELRSVAELTKYAIRTGLTSVE
jgi:two-component system NarL family response regulator